MTACNTGKSPLPTRSTTPLTPPPCHKVDDACTCNPVYYPRMLDADCTIHGLTTITAATANPKGLERA